MLIEIDQVKEISNGEQSSIDVLINSEFLDAITLDIFESHSKFKIYLSFDREELDEKYECHMCRLNEVITYLDSTMTGFHKIDEMLTRNKLIYVNLSKINLIEKMHQSDEKTKMVVNFIKGDYVTINNESEMEKLKQAMMNLNTVKKKVRMKQNFKEGIC